MADVPGGTSGLLVRGYKGKEADTPVYRFDTALLNRLRAMVSLPEYSPPMALPPTATADGWRDLREWDPSPARRPRADPARQRGADMADLPGGASGLLCRDYMGKEATGW